MLGIQYLGWYWFEEMECAETMTFDLNSHVCHESLTQVHAVAVATLTACK